MRTRPLHAVRAHVVLCLAGVLAFASGLSAQEAVSGAQPGPPLAERQPSTAELSGTVRDVAGRPVRAQRVTLEGQDPLGREGDPLRMLETQTSADGRYRFAAVTYGTWTLRADPPGVRSHEGTQVAVPGVSALDVRLPARPRARVIVQDADGDRVPAARVQGRWQSRSGGAVEFEAFADTDGEFEIVAAGGLRDGWFEVRADGFVQPTLLRIEGFTLDTEEPLRWTLARGARLHGIVEGPRGLVAGAVVHLATPSTSFEARRQTTTDAMGRYAFEGVPQGRAAIRVQATGWAHDIDPARWTQVVASQDAEPPPGAIEIPATGSVRSDVELSAGARVEGTVNGPDGQPLVGALVGLVGYPVAGVQTTTDERGRFRLSGVPRVSSLTLWARAADGRSVGTAALDAATLSARMAPLRTDLATTAVVDGSSAPFLSIRTADGRALEALHVDVWRLTHAGSGRRGGSPWSWVGSLLQPSFAAGGSVRHGLGYLADSGAGSVYRLSARSAGYATTFTAEFRTDRTTDLPELVLLPAEPVRGRVVDFDTGDPITGAWVIVDRAQESTPFPSRVRGTVVRATTDTDGRFRVEGFRGERPVATVHARGYLSGVIGDRLGQGDAAYDVRLRRAGRISGRVRDANEEPVEGANVSVLAGELSGASLTDADGVFALEVRLGKELQLRVEPPPRRRDELALLDVGPFTADATDLVFDLIPTGLLGGRIVDEAGLPVPGARVEVRTSSGRRSSVVARMSADAEGRFLFPRVPKAIHTLRVEAPEDDPNYLRSTIPGLATGADLGDFVLRRGLRATGRVLFPDGVSPEGRQLWLIGARAGRSFGARRVIPRAFMGSGIATTALDAEGRFAFEALRPGSYLLRLRPGRAKSTGPKFSLSAEIVAGSEDLELRAMTLGTMSGALIDERGRPASSCFVRLKRENAEPLSSLTDGNGRFSVRGLVEGRTYELIVDGRKHMLWQKSPAVKLGDEVTVNVRRIGTLHGDLRDAAGRPVGEAHVRVRLEESEFEHVFQVGVGGRFHEPRLPLGHYSVQVRSKGTSADGWTDLDDLEFTKMPTRSQRLKLPR